MTTSFSSANALGLPDRRRLLATLAGAGALGLPALPALAAVLGPIEAMWPEHLRLEAILDTAAMRVIDAEELYEEPERPRWHPFAAEGGYRAISTNDGRGQCVLDDGEENVAYLQCLIADEFKPDDAENLGYQHEVRAKRAKATLAKIEEWAAEVRRRKDAAGLTEAEADEVRATSAANAHRTLILAIEATSFRELAFQAALFDDDWRQREAERVLERLTELAGVTPRGAFTVAA